MQFPTLELALPIWVEAFCAHWLGGFATALQRASFVVALSRENVQRQTGGPFAAAVFDIERGMLVAPGLNRVVPCACSSAHAEIVALSLAQQVMGSHDLGSAGFPMLELVSSTEPCAMCLGAVSWSGVWRLVCCARGEDAEAIGMDEGDKPENWVAALEARGIAVKRDVCRDEAAAVLRDYAACGGLIYNGRGGGRSM
ncbi:MAG TPA: tRNA-specific adenosine deaminase [Verrucomicrobia bacterium]|nr:tRNA-specific adenosine deaminase [Verrucomicrobiota bacterium]